MKPDRSGTSGVHRLRRWLSHILTSAVIAALIYYVYRNIDSILAQDFSCRWSLLSLAFLSACAGLSVMFLVWERISRSFDLNTSRSGAARAFYASQLGKYVPGKFGLVLIRLRAYSGYPRKQVVLAMGVEYMASLISACLLVIMSSFFLEESLPPLLKWFAAALLLSLLVSLWPPVFRRVANLILRLLGREPVDVTPSFGKMLSFVLMNVLVGLLFGLSLYLVLSSLDPVPFRYYPAITGTFWAATLIGVMAIFAPSGIGVREGVLMLVLPVFISRPTVIVGAIVIRLVLVAAELLLAGLTALAYRMGRKTRTG